MPASEIQVDSLQGLTAGLRFCLSMLVLCGLFYSPLITLAAKALFPWQAMGSLIAANGKVTGSLLIGQSFVSKAYFHGRPSAADYDPTATAGSNFAPGNPGLRLRAMKDSERIRLLEGVTTGQIPAELLAASGSGLDPHISPTSARMQVPRIAKVRRLDETTLMALVNRHVEGRQFGILGQPRVNVLRLNIALDQHYAVPHLSE